MADERAGEDEPTNIVEDEQEKEQAPLIVAANRKFLLTLDDELVPSAEKQELKKQLLAQIERDDMAPFYKELCDTFKWPFDEAFHAKLKSNNDAEIAKIEAKITEVKENSGDTEVCAALLSKADYLAKIGEKTLTYPAYEAALEKSVGAGSRIDVVFSIIRVALFHHDVEKVKLFIDKAKGFVASGGDWERRNLLKIYEAIFCIMTREFKRAANLFLDSIATFTCYELCTYNTFIFYSVLSAVVAEDRTVISKKVVRSPEILSVYKDIPNLESFLQSLYKSKYAEFFKALNNISQQILRDPYLSSHFSYIVRELRVVAYKQFLQSYRSVKLESMAASFGISAPFLDRELSKFISSGRLNCKIDKVNGVVETNRPDAKNFQYQQVIKQGDILLVRIQKLTKSLMG